MDVPRSKIFDDIYFSLEDGVAETRHVFLDGNNLAGRFADREHFNICETGFGSGLNFFCAWEAFEQSGAAGRLHFISFEKYPLSASEIGRYLKDMVTSEKLEAVMRVYPSEGVSGRHDLKITDSITLTLIFGDMNEEISKLDVKVDAWFLDGFAPAKNLEMWSEILFENMTRLSKSGTTFATFTAAGFVKRGLQGAGFNVEKVPGFGRKREMLRGVYL